MKFSYRELKEITAAIELTNNSEPTGSYEISTDTRTISANNVYVPLKGESFDGELFIETALNKGVEGYFTSKKDNIFTNAKFGLFVEDTKLAYLKLSNYYKNKIKPTTIAITGSSGKTTTKEIFDAIFKNNRHTHKSALNHNNEIGLCQTLLSMPTNTEFLIVEMGMRGLGEIELLSKYAQPDYAVITNIGTAHIGRLGSRENIAKAKCEITKYMSQNGTLVTLKDELYKTTLKDFKGRHLTIDETPSNFKPISMTKDYSEFIYKNNTYKLNIGGEYNIKDALLAIQTALLCGLTPTEIQTGLATYKPIEKRFEETKIGSLNIINDSYNANPDSMKAAIKTFIELYEGEKILILADMKELGADEIKYHKEIGTFLNQFKNIQLYTVGNLAKNISNETIHPTKHFCSNMDVAKELKNIETSTHILLKGSRSMKLEEIIEEIKK